MKCITSNIILISACIATKASSEPFLTSRQHVSILTLRGGGTSGLTTKANCRKGERSTDVIDTVSSIPKAGNSQHDVELMNPVTLVINILADLCPHGMLPLAYGIGAGGGTGPVLASIILLFFGFLSWYSLMSFARAARETIEENHGEEGAGESISAVWAKTVTGGEKTAWIPDVGCAFLTLGCLLFYSAFIGDLFGSLAQGLLPESVPSIFKKRYIALITLHIVPILPLCLLRDLSALKYSSMVGLGGIVYTTLFVGKRMMDRSYAEGGKFFSLMGESLRPSPQVTFPSQDESVPGSYLFDIPPMFGGKGLLTLMNMCCVAFACHYNSVQYYLELKDRTLPKFGGVMGIGILGTATVFLAMMILGYGTFGASSQALILNNYHTTDALANLARFFTGVAILSGYPLMFSGLKSAIFSLAKLDGKDVENVDSKKKRLSIFFLSLVTIGACFVTEHELATVIGIVGSIFGSVVIYMFPAFVNNGLLSKKKDVPEFVRGERIFNNLLIVFGIVFAILGTWVSIVDGSSSQH